MERYERDLRLEHDFDIIFYISKALNSRSFDNQFYSLRIVKSSFA